MTTQRAVATFVPAIILVVVSVVLAWTLIESSKGQAVVSAAPTRLAFEVVNGRLPERLSQLGVFEDLAQLTPAAGVMAYEVRHPLWSDGTIKERHAFLPGGQQIAVEEEGDFVFPEGSLLTKTFSSPVEIAGRSHRRIETRVLYKHGGRWIYATYIWDRDGEDALLTGDKDVALDFTLPGCENAYVVPGRVACIQCHGGAVDAVIGFSGVQLGEEQTTELRRKGHLAEDAVIAHSEIEARSDVEKAALGYIHGNCAHCHNPNSPAYTGDELDLRHFHVLAETVGVEAERLVHHEAHALVTPGSPKESVLFRLFERTYTTEHDSDREKMMPPVGNDSVDPLGTEAIAAWITSLEK